MTPYFFFCAFLSGFFGFGAIYHAVLWLRSRSDTSFLVFALVCLGASLNAVAVLNVASAQTVSDGQRWLDFRGATALWLPLALAWLYAAMSGVRARAFLVPLSVVLLAALVVQASGVPLAGRVAALDHMTTRWGDTLTLLQRTAPSVLLQPIYAVAATSPVFGVLCTIRLWRRDRVGGALMAMAVLGYGLTISAALAVDVLGAPLPYVGPSLMVLWVLPIAWQVARASHLRDEQLRLLMENQTELVVSCGLDGTITFANESYCTYFGVDPERAAGTNLFERVGAREWNDGPPAVDEAGGRADPAMHECEVTRRDGERRWTQWTVSGPRDPQGRRRSLQLTGRDIQELVSAEQATRRMEQHLLQSQKTEALGQLAGGVAHDFNNLLTIISGHAELLLGDTQSEATRHDLGQIRLACERAAAMTRQLLAFSRQTVLAPRTVDLNAVVADVHTMLRGALGESIELIVQPSPDARCVKADSDLLVRAIMNIALNARDAMPAGGRFTVSTGNVRVGPGTTSDDAPPAPPGDYVSLTLADTGCGMTPECRARVFEPFFTTKPAGKGTGLGLSVVDGIVKQSGGYIAVSSDVGAGATFRVLLPALPAGERPPAAPVPERHMPGGRETVLLVEDVDEVRRVTQTTLERLGYTVLPASDGAAALAVVDARGDRLDIVVTDVVMPGMSGPELARRLRETRPHLPILFVSGFTPDAVFRDGVQAGHAHFLQKPFAATALASKLRQVLDRPHA